MKYMRPAIAVEAMYDKEQACWIVQYANGAQARLSPEEFQRDFRKMNGQTPGTTRTSPRRKKSVALSPAVDAKLDQVLGDEHAQ